MSEWSGRRVPIAEVLPATDADVVAAILDPPEEDARVAALDTYLLGLGARPDPRADEAMRVVGLVGEDFTIRRAAELASAAGISARSSQRLLATYVGVGPKWVILRHRIHEALERAEADEELDWAGLAAELGYSDQAHLVRDFTATVGVPPTAYARGPVGRRSPGVPPDLPAVRPDQ
ncbi:helix-turn-helix domain-containing protein [Streptomyces sp. NPDC051217]|uniref:helix-turn-helix domain-containing protein n=1 Tax=Streptomyces sp. NPDC051217 TaxID=3365644 RepID=UPI00378E1921